MKEQTSTPNPVEVWYRVTYSKHYYPPTREMKVQRTDLKDEQTVKNNMNRLIRQGAYASIILTLCIAACIFVAGLAFYEKTVTIKDILCVIGFIGVSYLCRIDSIKQKKVCIDFWASKMDEEQLKKNTGTGRIYITLLFVVFLTITITAFYHLMFKGTH